MAHTCILHNERWCLFFTPLSLRGIENNNKKRQKERKNLNIIMYMNSREKPTTLLCTVDECWEFKGISGFAFVIFHWLGRSTVAQFIIQPKISDDILYRWWNKHWWKKRRILFTFLHTSASWLCKPFYYCLSLTLSFSLSFCLRLKSNNFIIKMRSD